MAIFVNKTNDVTFVDLGDRILNWLGRKLQKIDKPDERVAVHFSLLYAEMARFHEWISSGEKAESFQLRKLAHVISFTYNRTEDKQSVRKTVKSTYNFAGNRVASQKRSQNSFRP